MLDVVKDAFRAADAVAASRLSLTTSPRDAILLAGRDGGIGNSRSNKGILASTVSTSLIALLIPQQSGLVALPVAGGDGVAFVVFLPAFGDPERYLCQPARVEVDIQRHDGVAVA